MAVLDSAYDLFSALSVAQGLSLLAGEAAEDLTKLADWLAAANPEKEETYNASNAAQLMPHLQQRSILQKAAAASTRQLELLSAHLQSATSLASLHGRALECAKVLLLTPTYLPHVWVENSAPSVHGTVHSQVQRELTDTGLLTAFGQAMDVAAAALRRLVPQGPLDMQQLQQLLHVLSYVLALLNAWYACANNVGNLSSSPPWPSTNPAFAALTAALLETVPVLAANPPLVAAALSPAGALGGSSSSRHGRGGHSNAARAAAARLGIRLGMDESVEHWEDVAWYDLCIKSMYALADGAPVLDIQLGITVRFDRYDPHLMSMLGS